MASRLAVGLAAGSLRSARDPAGQRRRCDRYAATRWEEIADLARQQAHFNVREPAAGAGPVASGDEGTLRETGRGECRKPARTEGYR